MFSERDDKRSSLPALWIFNEAPTSSRECRVSFILAKANVDQCSQPDDRDSACKRNQDDEEGLHFAMVWCGLMMECVNSWSSL